MGGPAVDLHLCDETGSVSLLETPHTAPSAAAVQHGGEAIPFVVGTGDPSLSVDITGPLHTSMGLGGTEALRALEHLRPKNMANGSHDGVASTHAVNISDVQDARAAPANGCAKVNGPRATGKAIVVERTVMANIPTGDGEFRLAIYANNSDDKEHMAMIYGRPELYDDVPVRIHCECFTGDVMGSLRCDCGEQLGSAMTKIAEAGVGVIVYLRQEGRGIGLVEKLRAYNLQDRGYDTVEANLALGHQADARDYTVGALILRDLGVNSVRILTNNPDKIECLRTYGISVSERIAMRPHRLSEYNLAYLTAKVKRMRHLLKLSEIGAPSANGLPAETTLRASLESIPRSPLRSPAVTSLAANESYPSSGSATPDIPTPSNSRAELLSSRGSVDADADADADADTAFVAHAVDMPLPSVELPGVRLAQRPFVTLTYAQSLDGCIATADRRPLMLSGPKSMTLTHGLRATHSAILVGVGTIASDDPRLTVRLVQGRNPQPVVLDSSLRFPLSSKLLSGPTRPWIFCGPDASADRRKVLGEAGATVISAPFADDGCGLSLPFVLRELANRGVDSLMVEGGSAVIQSFLTGGAVDRLIVTIAPVVIGGVSAVNRNADSVRIALPRLINPRYEQYGTDMVLFAEPSWEVRA